MANEAEQAIYSGLRAAPIYHPVDVTLLPDDWTLEAGDVVTVQNAGESYNVPVFALDYTWKGGLTAEAQSTGNQKREPLSALRKRYYGGVGGGGAWSAALMDKKFDLIASKVEFENLKNGGKTFFQDTSSKISTEETRAKAAEKTNSDNIGTLNTDFGRLTTGQLEAQSIVSGILAGTTLTAKNTFVYRTDTMYKRTLKLGTIQSADALAAGDATSVDFDHAHALSMDSSGHVTMGAAVSVGDSRATFNVAATTWFQQQMAAARQDGASGVTLSQDGWDSSGNNIVRATNGQAETVSLPSFTTSGGTTWANGSTTVYFSTPSVSLPLASKAVTLNNSDLHVTRYNNNNMRLYLISTSNIARNASIAINSITRVSASQFTVVVRVDGDTDFNLTWNGSL